MSSLIPAFATRKGRAFQPVNAAVGWPTRARTAQVGPHARGLLYRVGRHRPFLLELAVVGLIVLSAVAAPVLAPNDPYELYVAEPFSPPSWSHPMGTDKVGRDELSRVLYGGRMSLLIGAGAAGLAIVVGIALGMVSGFYGGVVDGTLMRIMDVLVAIPTLLLALAIITMLGASTSNLMIAIGISTVPIYARVVRGSVLSSKMRLYVEAAHCIGCDHLRIMWGHILPNVIGPIIVLSTVFLAGTISTGTALSFLGMGPQPPTPEWGAMLNDGQGYLRNAWWLSVFPGLAIALTVLVTNMLGDSLRDVLDPRMKV